MSTLVMFNDWFHHAQLWESVRQSNSDNPIHVLYYEDAKKVCISINITGVMNQGL